MHLICKAGTQRKSMELFPGPGGEFCEIAVMVAAVFTETTSRQRLTGSPAEGCCSSN
jgi:hypothetical protein